MFSYFLTSTLGDTQNQDSSFDFQGISACFLPVLKSGQDTAASFCPPMKVLVAHNGMVLRPCRPVRRTGLQ